MVTLRALGESVIEIGDVRIGPDAEIIFALLTYLIIERGRPVSRGELVELFWAGQEDGKARHCLRQAIYKLRRMGVPIATRPDGYLLPTNAATVDIDSVGEVNNKLFSNGGNSTLDVLPTPPVATSTPYRKWLEQFRERSGAIVRRAALAKLSEARLSNHWHEAMSLALRCLHVDPLNEEATLTLAEATALSGNKKGALAILDAYLADVGTANAEIRLPAAILRNRITERVTTGPTASAQHSAFVGRHDSLRLMQHLAREVAAGSGYVLYLCGEPGIGKSRLVTEFVNIAAMGGYRVIRAESRSGSSDQALSVFMAIAARLLRMPGALGCSPEALRLVRRLTDHASSPDDAEANYGDPRTLHGALRDALRDLVDAIASERPLIMVIEDVHWADDHSWSVLRELSSSNRSRPLMLVLTSRPTSTRRPTIDWGDRQVVTHELQHLTSAEAVRLATTIGGSLALECDASVIERCVSHAAGNPLFITELLCHWRETNDCTRVPPSLETLIRGRLSTLSPAGLRVLQAASMLEEFATYDNLASVLGLQRWQLLGAIEELDHAKFATGGLEGVCVKHDLNALAALQMLSPLSAGILHSSIAQRLASNEVAPTDSTRLWRAASHWAAAGNPERALTLAMQCARHLLSIGLAMEAANLLARSCAFCQSHEELRMLMSLRIDALLQVSALVEAVEACNAVLRMDAAQGQVHSEEELGLLRALVGLHAGGDPIILRAMQCVAADHADLTHRFEAAMWGLAACYAGRRVNDANDIMREVQRLTPRCVADRRYQLSASLIHYVDLGDCDQGISVGDALVDLERTSNDHNALIRALRVSAFPHRHAGNWAIVETRLAESAALAQERRHVVYYAHALIAQVQYRIDRRQLDDAWDRVGLLQRLSKEHCYLSVPLLDSVAAEVALLRGEPDIARTFLHRVAAFESPAPRHQADRIALIVGYKILVGEVISNDLVDELWRLHCILRDSPGHDFSASTLFAALRTVGREDEALRLSTHYLKVRKERWPAWHCFS